MEHIVEKLTLHCASFQEGFDLLCRAKSNTELSRYFFRILRGNLLVTEAAFFYRGPKSRDWELLYSHNLPAPQNAGALLSPLEDSLITRLNRDGFALGVVHPLSDGSRMAIVLGAKLDRSPYTDYDKIVLQFYLQQLGGAHQFIRARQKEKGLLFDLNHRVLQLNSLIDTGIEVSRLRDENSLLQLALHRALALTNAARGLLRVRRGRKVLHKFYFPAPFKATALSKKGGHIQSSFVFEDLTYQFSLFEKESRQGAARFDTTDHLLLEAFARQVHASLENHYLHRQALEKERVEKEISLAGAIQKKLIPADLPDIGGYRQAGVNIPTKYIGGDYYDCIPLNDGRFMFIMADVSGKGVAAGLLVSTLHASVHAYVESPFKLTELVRKLNRVIHEAATPEKYITAFFAVLEPQSGRLESVNAGHNPIYLLKGEGAVEELKTGGIPLGMMGAPFPYESMEHTLDEGSRLLMYTDGVTEAINENEEEYDDFRPLKDFLHAHGGGRPGDFLAALIDDLHAFTGETPQSDDITALYLIRSSSMRGE